jgi:hypothetical protein
MAPAMDEKELARIAQKKEPLATEMRRFIEARLTQGKSVADVLKEVGWDKKTVTEIAERLKEQKKPDRYYTSIREPLETDLFK